MSTGAGVVHQAPGTNAVEIRCNRTTNTCNEAVASILHHAEGEDLEAQVFGYQVSSWDMTRLEAVALRAMGECLERRLTVQLADKSAALSWSPPEGCEGDTGRAVLVGDPL